MHTDPIADFVIRIKNGYMAKKPAIVVPASKVKEELATILKREGFIADFVKRDSQIEIVLRYDNNKAALQGVARVSKPGLRVYANRKNIPRVLGGYGVAIVSTPQGLLTDNEARTKGLGGEVMLKVW